MSQKELSRPNREDLERIVLYLAVSRRSLLRLQ